MADKRTKRIAITVNEDMADWLQSECDKMGIQLATGVVVMLNEYRRSRSNNDKMMDIMKSFASSNPKDWSDMMKVAIESEQKKLSE